MLSFYFNNLSHNPIAFLILPAALARTSVTLSPIISPPSFTANTRTASILSNVRRRLCVSDSSSVFFLVDFLVERYVSQNCLRNSTEAECVKWSCDNTVSGRPEVRRMCNREIPSWSTLFSEDKDSACAFISDVMCLAAEESRAESRPTWH